MLDQVDLKAKLSKADYQAKMEPLDLRLSELQRELRAAGIPVVVVLEGWDAAGKGTVLGRVLMPLDPRGYWVHYVAPPTPEDRHWPPMWPFWNELPRNGDLAFFNHSWYRQLLGERVESKMHPRTLIEACERIRTFERQLADDGAVIIKFFLHISKKEQARRFERLAKDPAYAWKAGKIERRRHKNYQEYWNATEEMILQTLTDHAPWTLVPATDERYGIATVAETLVQRFEHALEDRRAGRYVTVELAPRANQPLENLDHSLALPREEYDKVLPKLQAEVRRLQHLCYVQRRPVVIVYEGWDAAGKGGNIRRLVREMDPRGYDVVPVAAPQGDEKVHHHLWRFWRALPKAGHFTIYDRSWYGRVMVERVEGFAKPHEWARAYSELNEFESQLAEYGAIIFKFWLNISKEEQLKRFEDRQNTPEKQWKITDEDWRNRNRWDDYWEAVSDMLDRTSTVQAPWTIVEGNNKLYARVKVLRVITDRLKKELEPPAKKRKKAR
jgi:polyphosphate:AMP phosphotransferase